MSPLDYQLFYQRHLPHYQPPGVILFITFCLVGSLPVEIIQHLEAELRISEKQILQIGDSNLRQQEVYKAQKQLFRRWDCELDAVRHGSFWLSDPAIAHMMCESLHYRDSRVYILEAFCVMPNHGHLVCTPLKDEIGQEHSLSAIMHSLKGYTALEANLLLGREGDFWQHESYDHVVRDAAELQCIVAYVVDNPVRAGLSTERHPNLPLVTDYFSIPEQGQYLVMDFVEGEDLQEMLEKAGGSLPESQVLQWMGQVCDALAYLHSQNPPVIHRDIKPANLRLVGSLGDFSSEPQSRTGDQESKIFLVDFGIAKLFDPGLSTALGARAVTPGYSPYEQYGKGSTDTRSDLYALGATLYTLLTGCIPPESIQCMLRDPLQPAETLNTQLSPHTTAALHKALQVDPDLRFQTAFEFKAAISIQSIVQSSQPVKPDLVSSMSAPGFGKAEEKLYKVPLTRTAPLPEKPLEPAPSRSRSRACLIPVSLLGLFILILVVVYSFLTGTKGISPVIPPIETLPFLTTPVISKKPPIDVKAGDTWVSPQEE